MHPLLQILATRPQLLVEHAQAYGELAGAEMARASIHWKRQTLLAAGRRHGFLLAAVGSLAHTLVSGYRRLRQRLGLTTYTPEQMLGVLKAGGFEAVRVPQNIGFSQHRMTFDARKV